jgi:hypothetical protein
LKKKLTGRLLNLARKIIKLFIKVAFYFLVFLIFLIVLLYIPPVQTLISQKTESIISRKLDSEVNIGALNLNLFGNLILKDIYIKDPDDIKVLEVGKIDINVLILPLFLKEVHLNHIIISGFKSSMEINPELKTTNLDFIIEAFRKNTPKAGSKQNSWEISASDLMIEESSYTLSIYKVLKFQAEIGEMKLQSNEMDLKDLDFNIAEINLSNINVHLQLFEDSLKLPSENKDPDVSKQYKNITSKLNQIQISNSKINLEIEGFLHLLTTIPEFKGEKFAFDLSDHFIRASELALVNANTEIAYQESVTGIDTIREITNDTNQTDLVSSELFIKKFGWDIGSEQTTLKDCDFKLDNLSVPDSSQSINSDHLHLKGINVSLQDALIAKDQLYANVDRAEFYTRNGFRLQELNGKLKLENDDLSLQDLRINTENSHLRADINLIGNLSESALDHPEELAVNITELEIDIGSKDLDYFSAKNILKESYIHSAQLSTSVTGTLNDLQIPKFNANLDNKIILDLKGAVKNLHNPAKICFTNLVSKLNINSESLIAKIDSLDGIDLKYPEEINIVTELKGCRQNLEAKTQILSNKNEELIINANYKDPGHGMKDSLKLNMNVLGLHLGNLLKVKEIGEIYFNTDIQVAGLSEGVSQFKIETFLDSLHITEYRIQNVHLLSDYEEDSLNMWLTADDSLLNLDLGIHGQIIDSVFSFEAGLDLKKFDLSFLGIVDKPVILSGQLSTRERIAPELFGGSFKITNAVIESERTYQYDTIVMDLYKMADSISFNIKSDFISGQFLTDIPLQDLDERILNFYKVHFIKEDTGLVNAHDGFLKFSLTSDRLLENLIVLIPGLEELQFSKIQGEINEREKTSYLNISVPSITYREIHFDSLNYHLDSEPDHLKYSFRIPSMSYQNYKAKDFRLSGRTEEGVVNNVLALPNDSNSYLIRTGFSIKRAENNQIVFNLSPDSLFIGSKLWNANGKNEIIFDRSGDIFGKIDIDDGLQSLRIHAMDSLYEFDINDFQLVNLSSILQNFDPEIDISGELNFKSDLILTNQELKVNANISLEDFNFQKTHFGDITIEAANSGPNNVMAKIDLENGDNKLSLEGDYNLNKNTNPLTAEAKIDFNDLNEFISFGKGFIQDPEGSIQGKISLSGDKNKISTNGKLDFKSVEMLLTPVNNRYLIENESVTLNNNTFLFKDFTLRDSGNQQFILNGTVSTNKFNIYIMDLKMDAEQFTVYNVSQKDNPNFYGSLIISLDATLKGTTENPDLLFNLSIDRGTNLTYALPPKNFDVVDSEGIVEFVNLSDPDSLEEIGFEQYIGDTIFSKLNWIDLNATLKIDRSAQFMIDMDPLSGDYIQFGGTGNLNLLVQKQQNPQITGTYEFDRGIYEVSFYGLVKKTFDFEPGSIISWSGDPYSAQMNLKARHNIRTASIGLVSREVYGLPDEEKSKYRRTLPYSVDINIKGQMDKPEIGFGIDLPEEEKSGFPLVEAKLNQLAESGNESELTRQVFGLLTIGSFIPETTGPGGGSDMGSAFATTAAANSLNSILTNELNKLSGKYITFADLDVGMQTFSDMGGGGQTNRTTMDIRLSKKLFNDRVTIEAQSSFDLHNEADKYKHATDQNTVHSDFAIIYDLTEKGDYKLKAFERSAYDIIYKDTRMGGVAIIFIKEFDKYNKDRKSRK